MKSLLPKISDRAMYKKLFSENHHWEQAIAHLINKHHLKGEAQRGVLGSHIVYRVGNCWLKLMAPIFAQDMAFELSGLRAVEGRLSVSSPKILAAGDLEGWPYVVISHIDGEPIRNVWSQFNLAQKTGLAEQMATVTKEISRCPADKIITDRFVWNEFIREQYDSCEDQQKKKDLPEAWLKNVKAFLHGFDITEFQTQDQVFLHADLTFDHFLVTKGTFPEISGIIDMADCQVGHFEYELVAPIVFIFKGNQGLLTHYLSRCGISSSRFTQRFSEKLLAWSILHRYFSLISYFQAELNACVPGDFHMLAQKVFPLS